MLAVIETGAKQYTVTDGTIMDIEKLNVQIQDKVVFDKVLLVHDGDKTSVGTPYLEGVTVTASVLNQIKDDKVIIFKFKRKTGYQKKQGHRQQYTTVKIQSIDVSN